jgi:hypothetical protein
MFGHLAAKARSNPMMRRRMAAPRSGISAVVLFLLVFLAGFFRIGPILCVGVVGYKCFAIGFGAGCVFRIYGTASLWPFLCQIGLPNLILLPLFLLFSLSSIKSSLALLGLTEKGAPPQGRKRFFWHWFTLFCRRCSGVVFMRLPANVVRRATSIKIRGAFAPRIFLTAYFRCSNCELRLPPCQMQLRRLLSFRSQPGQLTPAFYCAQPVFCGVFCVDPVSS